MKIETISSPGAIIAIIVLIVAIVAWVTGKMAPLPAGLFIGLAVARLS